MTKTARAVNAADEAAHQPETFRLRMTVDLSGPLGERLQATASRLGKGRMEVVEDGLNSIFEAMRLRKGEFLVDAWKEDEDGRVRRGREFAIGS